MSPAEVADAPVTEPTSPAEPASPASPSADAPPPPADAPLATDAETLPASDVPPVEGEPPAEAPAKAAEPDLSTYPVFTYGAEGREHEFAGAVRDDDGNVLFPAAVVPQLQHDLAYARAYQRRDRDARSELSREHTARQAAEATAQQLLATFDELAEKSYGASTVEDLLQTPMGQWLVNIQQNWPKLRTDAMQKGFELRTRQQDAELQQLRQADLDRQQRPVMVSRVEEAVKQWGTEAGLSEVEQQRLIRKFGAEDHLETLFPRLGQDDPVSGMRAGQRLENLEPLRQELVFLHQILQGRTPQQAAAKVAEENAKRQGQAGVKPPPMAGTGRGAKPAGQKPKTYTTTREADKDIWS